MEKKESAPKKKATRPRKPRLKSGSRNSQSGENANIALKYSGMAFQMIATILIITFIGKGINDYYEVEPAYITALFAVISIFVALYLSLKDILFPPK